MLGVRFQFGSAPCFSAVASMLSQSFLWAMAVSSCCIEPNSGLGGALRSQEATASKPVTADPVPELSARTPTLIVEACTPCKFLAGAGRKLSIRFSTKENSVTRGLTIDGSALSLMSHEATSGAEKLYLWAVDANFDGTLDLAVGPVHGTPNLELQLWVVKPGGRFEDVGTFTNLVVDPQLQELRSGEKGGHAGLLRSDKVYVWSQGRLQISKSSETKIIEGQYFLKTTDYVGGKVSRVRRQPVPDPSLAFP